ncbi:MAG: methylmalonyl Co-A mutase-associated GTPase MeaB [Crocinitomicaceae bacterium]|nr:methylmalonyl Co-A mutase-associated GTPase MeaB [Crocinitomicaceae bacterium]MDG1659740.1 methylmalonyl Co-A mutase-associated GTPase MeaB [Crocinitomicaceae bacterium]
MAIRSIELSLRRITHMKEKKIEDWLKKKRDRRLKMTPEEIFDGIRSNDVTALSTGITLLESQNPAHRLLANELIKLCLPYSGKSIRVGITGVPGVGKSTFIEAFGKELSDKGEKIAVLAIDPSSGVSGGSILGDKTRMNELSITDNVFIRPSAAGRTLGGVARATRESIILCEAAGFNYILIETVGVGQSEVMVKSMVDFFLLLMLSGAGDELQGIKKGIMEMADALLITKADGDNVIKSKSAAREYKNALHLFPANRNEWIPRVFTCSAITGENIDEVIKLIDSFKNHVTINGSFVSNRKEQDTQWLNETIEELILNDYYSDDAIQLALSEIEKQVLEGKLTSFQGAEQIHQIYLKKNGKI